MPTPIVWTNDMSGCLTIHDVTQLGRKPIEELRTTAEALDPSDEGSCEIFGRQVTALEAILKHTYKEAALMARRSESLAQEAEVWQAMSEFADAVMEALKQLKVTYPNCGTPELYDLALDYKLAAEKRHALTIESIKCQTLPMPDGLFPQTT